VLAFVEKLEKSGNLKKVISGLEKSLKEIKSQKFWKSHGNVSYSYVSVTLIFILNINVVLQTCSSKVSFITSLSSITVFSCAWIKRVFKGFLPLC